MMVLLRRQKKLKLALMLFVQSAENVTQESCEKLIVLNDLNYSKLEVHKILILFLFIR